MKSEAWRCDGCATVAMLNGKQAVEGWFEVVRHFDDGFVLTHSTEHYCGVACLAATASASAAVAS